MFCRVDGHVNGHQVDRMHFRAICNGELGTTTQDENAATRSGMSRYGR